MTQIKSNANTQELTGSADFCISHGKLFDEMCKRTELFIQKNAVMKPLFIPLKTEYFNAFKNGTKTHEVRFGNRWNKSTCAIGRKVILSKGYGNYERLNGVITSFEIKAIRELTFDEMIDATDVYSIRILKEYPNSNIAEFLVVRIGIKILDDVK